MKNKRMVISILHSPIRDGIGGGKCAPISMHIPMKEKTILTTASIGSLAKRARQPLASDMFLDEENSFLGPVVQVYIGVDTKRVPSSLHRKYRLRIAKAHQRPNMRKKVPGTACPTKFPMVRTGDLSW